MKKLFFFLALCASVILMACPNESSKAPAKSEHQEDAGHDHKAKDGHDHAKDTTNQHKEGDGHKH